MVSSSASPDEGNYRHDANDKNGTDNDDDDMIDMWKQMAMSPSPAAGGASPTNNEECNDNNNLNHTATTPPRLVYQSPTTQIYRHGSHTGIKVVTIPNHDDNAQRNRHKARIEHEQRISNHLPPSCPTRKIIKVVESQPDNGGGISGGNSLSFHFEWVSGITLEEWLQNRQQQRQQAQQKHPNTNNEAQQVNAEIKSRLRAAIAIAKTLSDYHDVFGVAHNNLSVSNILLETFEGSSSRGSDDGCNISAANLIDLSQSVFLKEHGGGSAEEERAKSAARRADLGGLGRVFQRLFGGGGDDDAGEGNLEHRTMRMDVEEEELSENSSIRGVYDDNKRKKRGKSSTEQKHVIEELPMYLASLISALLVNNNKETIGNSENNNNEDIHGGERYESVRVVLSDLKVATAKFDVYFRPFDWKEASLYNHLPVPHSAFYGRRSEMSILMNSLHSVISFGQPMMTVVLGHAGMGKSTLVNQIKKTVGERKGYLIKGKFDMADGSRPDSVLFEALDTFFGTLVVEGKDDDLKIARMRQRITNTVGFGISDLIQSIPNLGKLVPNDYSSCHMTAVPQQLLHRSKFLLCKLIGAIADADNPIVLVMDDLQWADATSLSVFETIVTDPDIQYCLYVGCYRDEVAAPAVEQMIGDIKSQGVNVFTINLGSFEKESVNTLISESMCLPPSLSQPLSAIIHSKTAGSPLFCVNFLNDGLIRFNLNTRRWEYHIRSILMKEIPLSVVQYMKSQLAKLPLSYRLVLKLASCLGDHFDYATFLKAKVRSDYDLDKVLPHVCQIGFLHELAPGKYMWAHDQVRQAAYELIPENMRESFHLLIGTRILMNTPENELDTAIFDVLGHMNKGIRLIQTHEQKYEVARLNLMAGESCIKTSSFHSAADYFTNGIKLLPGECWECEYNLTVKLHDAAQDAVFATGDFPTLGLLNSRVIANAKNFDDKLNSYNNIIRYLVSLGQLDQAISKCKSILKELGEGLPLLLPGILGVPVLLREFWTVKKMLGQYSGKDILGHKRMTDTRKLAEMEFLQSIISAGNNSADPRIVAILITRLVKLSLEFGLCDVSAFAFAAYGSMLVHGKIKDLEGGYFYGNLAIQVLNLLGANRFKARVFAIVYGFINIWRDPFQASLDNLLEGYNAGCVNGDMEYAYWNLQSYSGLALYTGQGLIMLQNNMRTYAKRAIQCKQMGAALGIVPFLSAVLELTGDARKEDIYKAFFNTTSDVLFQQLNSRNDHRTCMLILNNRKFTRIFTGDMDGAVEAYELSLSLTGGLMEYMRTMPYIMRVFADGLIALSCARKHGEDEQRWTTIGEGIIETMKKWTKISKWNFANKCYLLEAEYYFLKCNEMALEKYEASITAARSHRFIHEEGLAFSLCGQYHLSKGRKGDAQQNLTQAKRCYERWGARSLVDHMDTIISNIL